MADMKKTEETSERVRYKRVVRAAEELFKTYGFRGVTMEAIAQEAAVSKATLYSYFKNKDEIFIAVSTRMAELVKRAVINALDSDDKVVDDRIANAIIAKHRLVLELVRSSPHALDLFSHRDQLSGEIFMQLDRDILKLLQEQMETDTDLANSATRITHTLFYACMEPAIRCHTVEALEVELQSLVKTYLTGARILGSI